MATSISALALLGLPAAAQADPSQGEAFTLDCGDAGNITITTNTGNADWTPGFVVENSDVIVPLSFHFTASTEDGTVSFDELEAKGNAQPNRDLIECTIFEGTETITDPDNEFGLPVGTVVTFAGTVTGFLTGKP
jgi:hypothetical protein